ncbi:MAG: FAD-dependent oxidoreductase [Candidatus Devosia symbiotica]|nr:FAD-dependent oxidoreductase [Candidatus Devosia symbiotica]
MADILKTDLCIIGADARGTALAIQARALNLGGIPVQRDGDKPCSTAGSALQAVAFSANAERAQAIRTTSDLSLRKLDPKPNFRAIAERVTAIAESTKPATTPERLTALGVIMLTESAIFSDRRSLKVGASTIRADQFVLAIGSLPMVPDLPELDQVPYFIPDTILANMRKLSHLLVLGSDTTALELAQAYARLGAEVALVPHGLLLAGFDPELVSILLRTLRKEGVNIPEGPSITAILLRRHGTGVAIAHADSSLAALDVSHILAAFGRVPDLDPALLEAVRLKRNPQHPDHPMVSPEGQTSNGHVVAISSAAEVFYGATRLAPGDHRAGSRQRSGQDTP